MKLLVYLISILCLIASFSVSLADSSKKARPVIAVILPTDPSNFNAVGNVLDCIVNATLEKWRKNGFEFETEFFNDKRDAAQAATVAELISKKKFNVAIGTTLSSQALIVSKILDQAGIPFIAPLATHPDVVQGKKLSLRLPFSDEIQAVLLAKYSLKRMPSLKSVLIIENQSIPYSTYLSKKFEEEIRKLNRALTVSKIEYIDGNFNKDTVVKAYLANMPELVFVPLYSLDVAASYSALASQVKTKTILLSSDTVGAGDSFYDAMGPKNSLLDFFFVQHNPKEFTGPRASEFKKLHSDKCAQYELNMNSAAGFDLADSTLSALFSKNYDLSAPSFKKVYMNQNYEGTLGQLHFGLNSEPMKAIHMYRIEKRSAVFVESLK